MKKPIEIKLDEIALRNDLSPRNGIDDDVVDDYVQCITDLPPVLVAMDKAKNNDEALIENEDFEVYVLIDGWHRYYAYLEAKRESIPAIVDKKLKPENFFFTAVRSNKTHGLRFSAREKERISKYLFMKENRSAAEISEAIGCSIQHARSLIKDLADEKREQAIKYAIQQKGNFTVREISKQLKGMGFKSASKSNVSRWLQPEADEEPEPAVESQIEEVSEVDRWEKVKEEMISKPVMNVSGEVAHVALPKSMPKTRVGICPECEIRTVRVPNLEFGISAGCTKIYFYCDRCKKYIEIKLLKPKPEE